MDALRLPSLSVPTVRLPGQTRQPDKEPLSYIKDGLVFHLDGIDKGTNPDAWTDLVGGISYPLNGNRTTKHSVIVTNYMYGDKQATFSVETHTIEVCLECDSLGENVLFSIKNHSVGLQYYATGKCLYGGSKPAGRVGKIDKSINRLMASFVYDYAIVNGEKIQVSTLRDAWDADNANKFTSNWANVNPRIHSIRIYNRQLTQKEMLHNQEVDKKRFNLTILTPHELAVSAINNLAEIKTPQSIVFQSNTYDTLTDEEIALATSKGWSIVSA